jgi:hypothetical protein
MGTLHKYDLQHTQCQVFFETGTDLGHSLKHALDNGNFSTLYSSEIHAPTADRASALFAPHPQVHIMHSDSTTALGSILRAVPSTSPIFFFLDAHFPGEVEVGYAYSGNIPNGVTIPLQEELQIISQLRPSTMDVIVVDDLKLYEDGPFENGQISDNFANISPSWRSLDFVQALFPDKTIEKSYLDDGYLILKPHSSNFSLKKLSAGYRIKRTIKKNVARFLG